MSSFSRWTVRAALTVAVVCSGVSAAESGWTPRRPPADAPVAPERVNIVDFGHDFLRDGDGRPVHQFHVHRWRLERDAETGLYGPAGGGRRGWHTWTDVEVDGDPNTPDLVGAIPFSMERPVSPVAPWYDRLAGSPRWYGGAAIYKANSHELHITETGVNQDHDGPPHYPRDNWALFHEVYEIDAPYRLCGLWVWKKQDFLNGGRDHPVSFSEGSELALYLQRYFMGLDGVRFVVREGEKFYVSERVFRGAGQVRGSGNGKQHVLRPTRTRWASYDPEAPYHIRFDADRAEFRPHQFEDVTAVGFYAYKDKFVPGYFGFKWYAFEADALVHRPSRPSEHMRMERVEGDINVPPFYVAATEVPYELWKNVFRLARRNTFVRNPRGFIFRSDGDMGSMDYPGPDGRLLEHGLAEPVTDLTLYDMVAWCNALSVQESRTPCYYVDPECRAAFHCVTRSPLHRENGALPSLYVKWEADGYRLPTPGEWRTAFAGQEISAQTAWTGANSGGTTHPVGLKAPNGYGLHDMAGNVWEAVWRFGSAYSPDQDEPLICLGGSFTYPRDPMGLSANPHGDEPFRGSFQVGFRPVRRASGGRGPRHARLPEDVPRWDVARGDRTASGGDFENPVLETVGVPGLRLEAAVHETTYAHWKRVRDWAEGHGYSFDHDGDMGSMDWWGYGDRPVKQTHGPDEPVTDVTLYDAHVWCNALSEMEGREPVYHADQECTEPYRKAFVYRPLMMQIFEAQRAEETGVIDRNGSAPAQEVYAKEGADGYRLPSPEEFNHMATAGKGARYSWGDEPEGVFDHAWLFDTADGTTHSVGRKQPNALRLHDVDGNVSEMGPSARAASRVLRHGGSFIDLTVGMRRDRPPFSPSGWGYPDVGFRVMRQTPAGRAERHGGGTPGLPGLSAGGILAATGEGKEFNIAPDDYDPLQGRVYRGNLRRDGTFETSGLTELHGLNWRFRTGGPVKSSPVAVDGTVYFGSLDGNVYAVDAETGREVWKFETGGPVAGSAAVVGGTVYIAGEDGSVYALEAKSGKRKWHTDLADYPPYRDNRPAGSPAVAYGTVFVFTGNAGGHDKVFMANGPTVGLDAETGEKVWQANWGNQGYGSPLIEGDILCGNDNPDRLGAVDLETGRVLWKQWLSGQSRDFASPAISRGVLYGIGSLGGDVMAADPRTGKIKWRAFAWEPQVALRAGGELGHEVMRGPAVAHGRLYVINNDGNFRTFDAETGERGWVFRTGDKIQSAPAVAGGAVYFGCHDGKLYALNALEGNVLWWFEAGAPIVSSPWPGDGALYFGCDDGNLYALRGN